MKKFLRIALVVVALGFVAWLVVTFYKFKPAMELASDVVVSAAQPNAIKDPACFVSDVLRVEIGGEKFAFPRKMVRSLRGADVRNIKDPKDNTVEGSKACQRAEDRIWRLDYASLDLRPVNCPDDAPKCDPVIHVQVYDLENRRANYKWDNVYPDSKEELLQRCVPPLRPFNEWDAKYWNACDYVFESAGLYLAITFRGGFYPPEQIERTKELVLETIRKYHLK